MSMTIVTTRLRAKGFVPVPSEAPFREILDADPAELEEREAAGGGGHACDTTYETGGVWKPIRPGPGDLDLPRYVDGTAHLSVIAHHVNPDGRWVSIVGGSVGAMALRIENDRAQREPEAVEDQHLRVVVAMRTRGYPEHDIEQLRQELLAGDIHLLHVDHEAEAPNLVATIRRAGSLARQRGLREMKALEKAAARAENYGGAPVTVVDGPLGDHVSHAHAAPLVGVVKRHAIMRVQGRAERVVLSLREGERSPAFRVPPVHSLGRPAIVSWYLKLRSDGGIPLMGTVRVEVAEQFALAASGGELTKWLDAISNALLERRAYRRSYQRQDCSLDPIVILEDRLHAIAGRSDHRRIRLIRQLGL